MLNGICMWLYATRTLNDACTYFEIPFSCYMCTTWLNHTQSISMCMCTDCMSGKHIS